MAKENKITNGKYDRTKLIIRITAFALALIVAALAFAYLLTHLGAYEVGYNIVEPDGIKDIPHYEEGIMFSYYLNDTQTNMKTQMKTLKTLYSDNLSKIYILLDPIRSYTGYNNIYKINTHLDEDIIVTGELYNILLDAYEKTKEQKGYNMFAGALFSIWTNILLIKFGDGCRSYLCELY